MDPVMGAAAITAGATAGAGLLQGILAMEAEKRKLALEKSQWEAQQRENRFSQELSVRSQLAQQPTTYANQQSNTLQGLIQALGGTR